MSHGDKRLATLIEKPRPTYPWFTFRDDEGGIYSLRGWQIRNGSCKEVGDRVVLRYERTSSSGLWNCVAPAMEAARGSHD